MTKPKAAVLANVARHGLVAVRSHRARTADASIGNVRVALSLALAGSRDGHLPWGAQRGHPAGADVRPSRDEGLLSGRSARARDARRAPMSCRRRCLGIARTAGYDQLARQGLFSAHVVRVVPLPTTEPASTAASSVSTLR
jgi:hypothetical protein